MDVTRFNVFGSPNIGIYSRATDKFAILPSGMSPNKTGRVKRFLKVKVLSLDVGYSKLIGVLTAANSQGILLPHYASDEEASFLKVNLDIRVERVASNKTAFGNLVLANDKGALVSPLLNRREVRVVEDVLGVNVEVGTVVGMPLVGAFAAVTNRSVLAHPNVSERDVELLSRVLHVPVGVGTVNNGVSYVSSGILANSHGALAGSLTTGPELMMISSMFS